MRSQKIFSSIAVSALAAMLSVVPLSGQQTTPSGQSAANPNTVQGQTPTPVTPETGAPPQVGEPQGQAAPAPVQRERSTEPAQSSPAPTGARAGAANEINRTQDQVALHSKQMHTQPVVIRGGKVLTITHGTIDDGIVVLENGRIAYVGPAGGSRVPAGAKVIDATGMTVYPGLIDIQTDLGLVEIEAERNTVDKVESSDEITPQMHVYDAFHAESERIPVTRINGVTNALIVPAESNTLPGQDTFVQLAGRDRDAMIMVEDIAMPLNFGANQRRRGGPGGGIEGAKFPSTRMGLISQMRQAFFDAQDYEHKLAHPSGRGESVKRDLKLEALLPYLHGERPVIIGVFEGSDIVPVMNMAKEFDLKVILNHVTRADDELDRIATYHVPVIVGPIYDLPNEQQRYDAVFKLPGELQKRGVKIAFASYDSQWTRNLAYSAGYAVAFGLPYDEALKAITINPAEMLGLDRDLGSIEKGKLANIVVSNGDPLDVKTDVKHVFIAGEEVPLVSKQTRLRDEYWPKNVPKQ